MMNVALWAVQIFLFYFLFRIGLRKLTYSMEKLRRRIDWANDFSASFVRFIGFVETAGALGLILPAATGVLPVLTPVAAAGICVLMVFGAILHVSRREYIDMLRHEPLIFTLAFFIAWGRF